MTFPQLIPIPIRETRPDDDVDMRWYDEPQAVDNERIISAAHVIRPGFPGLECLAGADRDNITLTVIDGWVTCPSCGNALGRADQLMIHVWDNRDLRSRFNGTAYLAFVG